MTERDMTGQDVQESRADRTGITPDRALLELAAKAAGLEIEIVNNELSCWVNAPREMGGWWKPWNPLTDSGDALELGVQLGMEMHCDDEATHAAFAYARIQGTGDDYVFESVVSTPVAAMCRAVVRAAAAMTSK